MLEDLRHRHLCGRIGGQVAVCCAHPQVLRAAADQARRDGTLLLVETTANQVNLSGGYTGMTPADFAGLMTRLARESGLDHGQIVLGADHLGLHLWRGLPSSAALAQAEALARAFAAAGYRKLHLDTGTGCADDPPGRLPLELAAQRAAVLCRAAESAARESHRQLPLYVIGTEAPAPGGALKGYGAPAASDPQLLQQELAHYETAFSRAGLPQAWGRVLALVVQPGVDFDDYRVAPYKPEAAAALSAFHDRLPSPMTFEIHATDYQTPSALKQMVQDHFCLLKVGPCLTAALREALFALARIEDALPGLERRSNLIGVMEQLMLARPEHWSAHYRGTAQEQRFLRRYSLRDRIRYYWPQAEARQVCEHLIANLRRPIPQPLLRQFLPDLVDAITSHELEPEPQAIIQARIRSALNPYTEACRGPAGS
jgi:D-tagatose-1,6-bisphosphate aldolase subunit GatZ/KbaZ